MDIRDPGNDHALTADEAQAWKAIERSLRLRVQYRHRLAALTGRLTAEPLIVAGLAMLLGGAALVAAVLLPATAALVAALSTAGAGLGLLAFGLVRTFRPRRPQAVVTRERPALRLRLGRLGRLRPGRLGRLRLRRRSGS